MRARSKSDEEGESDFERIFTDAIIFHLASITLSLALAASAAEAPPVRGLFSGVIASVQNADFTMRYRAGDNWSLSFQFQAMIAPAFVGSNFADYSLSAFNFVSLTLNGFSIRPVFNGFAMRVRKDTFSLFGNLNTSTFPNPFIRNGFYEFFIRVEGPGISTNFADLSTLNPQAIEQATPFSLL